MKKAVIIYSGGMDSFTLLHHAIKDSGGTEHVAALSFDYGQKHKKELHYAIKTCVNLGVTHRIIRLHDLQDILKSALTTSSPVPEGHYTDENMKLTVVPNRNMIMLSMAAGYAITAKASRIYYGAQAGDYPIYPDCRKEFVDALNVALDKGNYDAPRIVTPFIHFFKQDILRHGINNLALTPHDYIDTWTCYNGRKKACGVCGSCTERLEAFEAMHLIDPLEYE